MFAMVLERPRDYRVAEVPVPTPESGQALIRIRMAGICATDLATIDGHSPIAVYPLIPGHECIAEVVEVPADCGYAAGDTVTVFPSVGCGTCRACREGRTNHCPTFKVQGIGLPGGCFAEYMAVNVDQLVPVPETVSDRFGALVEPLAVGVHINGRAECAPGATALVVGSGVIGLMTAQVARARGAARVVLVDRYESRRHMAARLGFTDFSAASGEDLQAWLKDEIGAFDVVFDTVCQEQTLATGMKALRPGGRYVLIALPHGADQSLSIPYSVAYRNELSFVVSRNYVRQDFLDAVELLQSGALDPASMVTATFPLERMGEALTLLAEHPDEHLKVMVAP